MKVAVIVGVILAVGEVAHAECKLTEPAFLPSPGTVLPMRPTFYVVVPPALRETPIRMSGAKYTVKRIARSDAYDVMRVDVEPLGDTLELRAGTRVAQYHLDPTTRYASFMTLERVRDFGELQLEMRVHGNAIALRFSWPSGASTIVPIDHGVARLGKLDCIGMNVSPKRITPGEHEVTLLAQFPDGGEEVLGHPILRREGESLHLDWADGLGHGMETWPDRERSSDDVVEIVPTDEDPPLPTAPSHAGWLALHALLLLLAGVLVRRDG